MSRVDNARPFGARDKIGYMLGNMGNDFTFTFASVFLLVFYTKVLGIPSVLVGTMFLIARFIDAFTDITAGHVIDKIRPGKNGKFRPIIRYMCAPVAIASFLMYQSAVSDAPMWIRITYMFVTYLVWGSVFYTCINIPYGSMASALSAEADDRAALSTYRSVGSVIANLAVGVGVPYLVYTSDAFGNQIVKSEAFVYASAIFSGLAMVLYLLCYYLTTERVIREPVPHHRSAGLIKTASELLSNRALIGIVLASVCVLAAQLLSQAINQYLFIDYFSNKSGVMVMSLISMIPGLLLAPIAVPLSRRFGKKEIGAAGCLIGAISCFVLFILRTRSMWIYIAVNFLGFLGFGVFNLITWAFVTDVIDDSEVKTGHRKDGTIYAVYSFARKVGQAIAGGLGGWTLAWIGFNESAQVQTEQVAQGIYTVSTLLPAILYSLVALALWFVYPLGKKEVEYNVAFLKEKHAKG